MGDKSSRTSTGAPSSAPQRIAGLGLVLLGAWAGVVGYVGPAFGYRMSNYPAWAWTAGNAELHLAPGALGVLAGLTLLIAPSGSRAPRLAAIAAQAAGAWVVLGPLFGSRWLGAGQAETRIGAASLGQTVQPLGFHYGTGLVIVAVASWVLGRQAGWGRGWAPTPSAPSSTWEPPVGTGAPAETPVAAPVGGRHRG